MQFVSHMSSQDRVRMIERMRRDVIRKVNILECVDDVRSVVFGCCIQIQILLIHVFSKTLE